jgi:hypothetical protein
VYCSAGALLFLRFDFRPLRTNWLIVGIMPPNLNLNNYFFPIMEAIIAFQDGLTAIQFCLQNLTELVGPV